MNNARLRVSILAIGIVCYGAMATFAANSEAIEYVTEDHLVPRNPEIDGALRPVLEKKLFLTPANCALLLIRPAGRAEAAVAVYSKSYNEGKSTFAATLTEVDKSIDVTMAVAPGRFEEVGKIAVKRRDVPMSSSAALALNSAWRAMLNRTNKESVYARPTLDREEFEFSILVQNTKPLYGTLPNKGGKNIAAFVKLGRLLVGYCKASPAKRVSIANQIERDANRLVQSVANTKN